MDAPSILLDNSLTGFVISRLQHDHHLEKAQLKRAEETPEQHDQQAETAPEKRSEETTEQCNHWLEQCCMQEQARQLRISSEEASIRRSVDAS